MNTDDFSCDPVILRLYFDIGWLWVGNDLYPLLNDSIFLVFDIDFLEIQLIYRWA